MANLLTSAFGSKASVQEITKRFAWSKIDLTTATQDDVLFVPIAPSIGELTAKTVGELPTHTKVAIASALRGLDKVSAADRSYEKALSVLMQNALIDAVVESGSSERIDKVLKTKKQREFFGSKGVDAEAVEEVKAWLADLSTGDDVAKYLKVDFDAIGNLVAKTDSQPEEEDDSEADFEKVEKSDAFDKKALKKGKKFLDLREGKHEKTIVDLSVLKFPTAKSSTLKIYRIQITAWAQTKTVSFLKETVAGITAEYTSRDFEPRATLINELSEASAAKAIAMADSLFD